jgi:hypothetical protein
VGEGNQGKGSRVRESGEESETVLLKCYQIVLKIICIYNYYAKIII